MLLALLGLIPAEIARRKGHAFVAFWLVGAALFIVALPVALLIKPNAAYRKQCPQCRSWIDRKASPCASCGAEQAGARRSPETPPSAPGVVA